jgi:hypothetical protein
MIEFIVQCLTVSLSIAIGIVFIYGCTKTINRLFQGKSLPCGKITVKNFVADNVQVDVKLSDGSILKDKTFVGFADFGTAKDIPFEFKTWLVLESDEGRSFIKPQTVRSITETTK